MGLLGYGQILIRIVGILETMCLRSFCMGFIGSEGLGLIATGCIHPVANR